jgi:hypothetical protein
VQNVHKSARVGYQVETALSHPTWKSSTPYLTIDPIRTELLSLDDVPDSKAVPNWAEVAVVALIYGSNAMNTMLVDDPWTDQLSTIENALTRDPRFTRADKD